MSEDRPEQDQQPSKKPFSILLIIIKNHKEKEPQQWGAKKVGWEIAKLTIKIIGTIATIIKLFFR